MDDILRLSVEDLERVHGSVLGVEARLRLVFWLCRSYDAGRADKEKK